MTHILNLTNSSKITPHPYLCAVSPNRQQGFKTGRFRIQVASCNYVTNVRTIDVLHREGVFFVALEK